MNFKSRSTNGFFKDELPSRNARNNVIKIWTLYRFDWFLQVMMFDDELYVILRLTDHVLFTYVIYSHNKYTYIHMYMFMQYHSDTTNN